VADRGLCSSAHLARLAPTGVQAVRHVAARQMVDFTPGRPLVTPRGRRTPAVQEGPRSRWLTALGHHDPLGTWLKPTTCPSWLAREPLAARPEALVLREGRAPLDTPGVRTRQITLVTTRLDPARYPVTDLAELSCQRWQVDTALAHLKTTRRMDVRHGQTAPGVLQERTICALVDNLGRLVMGHSARLPHIHVERIRCLDALRWLGAPPTGMSRRALLLHPIRPQRVEPRVKKRRPQSFPLMITPRHARRQQLVHQEVRA
jgi:hypothetical protein